MNDIERMKGLIQDKTEKDDSIFVFTKLDALSNRMGFGSSSQMLTKSLREVLLNEGGRQHVSDVFNSLYTRKRKLTFFQREVLFIDSSILNLSITKLMIESFRNGIKIVKKFEKKCTECGQEYKVSIDSCEAEIDGEMCGGELRSPDPSHEQRLKKVQSNSVNPAKHSLAAVGMQVNIDVEKHDYGLLLNKFKYKMNYNDTQVLLDKKGDYIRDYEYFYRGDPSRMRPTMTLVRPENPRDEAKYQFFTVCPIHRREIHIINENELEENQYCSQCKMIMEIAEYVLLEHEDTFNAIEGYLHGEVIKVVKYEPAQVMGQSKIDSLLYSIMFSLGNHKFMAEYASGKRNPRGFFEIKMSGNYDQTRRIIEQELEKFYIDPMYTPYLPVGKDGGVVFHKIDDSPLELQWESQREEARRLITSTYGVSNVFTNDTSTSGGLNNEGLQMTVTNRAVAFDHSTNNDQMWLPLSASILGVPVDEAEYYYEHELHEEMDQMAELTRESQKLSNAQQAQGIGIDVVLDQYGEFVYKNPLPDMPLVSASQMGDLGMGMGGIDDIPAGTTNDMQGAPAKNSPQGTNMGKSLAVRELDTEDIIIPEDYLVTDNGIMEGTGMSATTGYFVNNPDKLDDHPIDVDKIDGKCYLTDGYHRLQACTTLRRDTIKARVTRKKYLSKFIGVLQKRSWEDFSYEEQTQYLKDHPKSSRKVTRSPDQNKAEEAVESRIKTPQMLVSDKLKVRQQLKQLMDNGFDEDSKEYKILNDRMLEIDNEIENIPVKEKNDVSSEASYNVGLTSKQIIDKLKEYEGKDVYFRFSNEKDVQINNYVSPQDIDRLDENREMNDYTPEGYEYDDDEDKYKIMGVHAHSDLDEVIYAIKNPDEPNVWSPTGGIDYDTLFVFEGEYLSENPAQDGEIIKPKSVVESFDLSLIGNDVPVDQIIKQFMANLDDVDDIDDINSFMLDNSDVKYDLEPNDLHKLAQKSYDLGYDVTSLWHENKELFEAIYKQPVYFYDEKMYHGTAMDFEMLSDIVNDGVLTKNDLLFIGDKSTGMGYGAVTFELEGIEDETYIDPDPYGRDTAEWGSGERGEDQYIVNGGVPLDNVTGVLIRGKEINKFVEAYEGEIPMDEGRHRLDLEQFKEFVKDLMNGDYYEL